MQPSVGTDRPPRDPGAESLQGKPRRDVRFVIDVGDDDLVPYAERLADGQTDRANERRRVEAEGDLVRRAGVDERGDALACAGEHRVHFLRVPVDASALYVARHEMAGNRLEHARRNLGAGRVVEEDEPLVALQAGELPAQLGDGEPKRYRRVWLGHA